MKTGKLLKKIFALLLTCSLLVLCGCETESDRIFNELMGDSGGKNAELEGDLTIRTVTGGADYEISLPALAREFMRLHPDVTITIEQGVDPNDLNDGTEYADAMDRLVTELMSGEAADIVQDQGVFTTKEYVESGLVYDISEWMENDPDFNKEDYYWNLFEPFIYDEQLCTVPLGVSMDFVWLNKNLVEEGEYEPWDTIDYKGIMALYDRAAEKGLLSENFTMSYMDTRGQNSLFSSTEFPAFIDSVTGECSFDSPEFIEYLEETKRIPTERDINEIIMISGKNVVKDFSDSIAEENSSLMVFDWTQTPGLIKFESPPENCVGPIILASHEGDISYYPEDAVIVPKSCKNPELAWEFIKFCIAPVENAAYRDFYTPEGGVDICNYGPLLVAKENLKNYAQLYAKVDALSMEKGYFKSDEFDPESMDDPLSEETMSSLDGMMSSINCTRDHIYGLSTAIDSILKEYYSSDLMTAEDCAKQLQERAYIYLNE